MTDKFFFSFRSVQVLKLEETDDNGDARPVQVQADVDRPVNKNNSSKRGIKRKRDSDSDKLPGKPKQKQTKKI